MSAPTATLRALPLETKPLGYEDSRSVRILFSVTVAFGLTVLDIALIRTAPTIPSKWQEYLLWLAAIAATELLSVPVWGSVVLTMSLPLVLAAGIVFMPPAAAVLAFLGSVDPREFRGEIGLMRALYNRSQVMISALAASLMFHELDGDLRVWPLVLAIALAMVAVDFLVNAAFVSVPIRLHTRVRVLGVIKSMFGESGAEHATAHVCLGLLALPLALTYRVGGPWALIAFLSPVIVVRQLVAHSRRLARGSEIIDSKNRALASSVERLALERRDERLIVAGGLHDDVIQPLYKVHLMGQVLRQDLAAGRLLELDKDLPALLEATSIAQDAIRELIHELRSSALGPDGLVKTLRLLIRDVESSVASSIQVDIEEVGGAASIQLLVYQVIREAVTNAARYANADHIQVRLTRKDDSIRASVEDDGKGFDPEVVDKRKHFGLQMLLERVDAAGGLASIESQRGSGTRIVVCLPADGPWRI